MKNIAKSNWFMVPMIFFGLILLKAFTGIPLWFMVGVVLFFTVVQLVYTGGRMDPRSKGLAILLALLFVWWIGNSFLESHFPRTHAKIIYAAASLDIWGSGIGEEKAVVRAADMWEMQKDEATESFLYAYNKLLRQHKTDSAAALLKAFNKQWDTDKLYEEESEERQEVVITNSSARGSVLYDRAGEYDLGLAKGQTSPWIIIGDCCSYSFKGSACTFVVIYEDGERINSWDNRSLRANVRFYVENLTDVPVVLQIFKE